MFGLTTPQPTQRNYFMAIRKFSFFVLLSLTANLVSFAALATSEDSDASKIVWSCEVPYTPGNVLWLVEWGESSYVKLFEERFPAEYRSNGLHKRWNWGAANDGTYDYSIRLGPDLVAKYYDSGSSVDEKVDPSAFYKCSKD